MKNVIVRCTAIVGLVGSEYIAYLHGIDGVFLGSCCLLIGAIAGVPIKDQIKNMLKK